MLDALSTGGARPVPLLYASAGGPIAADCYQLLKQDLVSLMTGVLVPTPGEYPEWLTTNSKYAAEFHGRSRWLEVALYLTAVGGGAFDYIGYVGMLRDKKWDERE